MSKKEIRQGGAWRPFRFCIVSLGCAKNTVDANGMGILLQRAGFQATEKPESADFVIVNTCGFIQPAREESLETMRSLAGSLRRNQKLLAAGCWAQRQPELLIDQVPRLDAVLGTRDWHRIVALLQNMTQEKPLSSRIWVNTHLAAMPEEAGAPGYAISGRSAFLKIADGCNRSCAFCAIPSIKGRHISRSASSIIRDARALQNLGVHEINLIAQDTTYYGYDLGMKEGLAQLLEDMVVAVPEVPWIRVLYAFPGFVTPRLIDVISRYPQILPYIDIPLQHAHPAVLRRMLRPDDINEVRHTIELLRKSMPDVAIRTTFVVGFPGETDEEFEQLMDFINEMRFDRVGVFEYSHEVGTPASQLPDDIPPEVKAARRQAVMLAQQEISLSRNAEFVGRQLMVLVEGSGDDVTIARSYRDAPEIDGLVLIPGLLEPNQMVSVQVTEALEYDLVARVVEDSSG
ncbi:MAG: 30S ribosomal protein S12 methylthiotransferase RimO [Anaerolineae bacterium]|nr:30S ribosomal protein S12 methylthiotransferase RimO [Anaerolineae bacterium]